MSAATSRSRAASSTVVKKSNTTRHDRRSYSLGLALALAVIPLAVGLGVLVGRASNSGDDKLIAALRAQKPEVIATGGGTAAAAAATTASGSSAKSVVALESSFPLQNGYAVQLQTLPASTPSSAVTKAGHAATTKGAPHTGLILQRDFRVTRTPPRRWPSFTRSSRPPRSSACSRSVRAPPPRRFWQRRTTARHTRSRGSSQGRPS
jgi:hypothetical protein